MKEREAGWTAEAGVDDGTRILGGLLGAGRRSGRLEKTVCLHDSGAKVGMKKGCSLSVNEGVEKRARWKWIGKGRCFSSCVAAVAATLDRLITLKRAARLVELLQYLYTRTCVFFNVCV